MKRIVAFTSFTFAYLPRALVLARTLRLAHPGWSIVALIVDVPDATGEDGTLRTAFDRVVYAQELGIERFDVWMFRHDLVEACTAVKGQMLCNLLAEGADGVIYLDPDIAVFHGLDDVVDLLDRASVVLTPHQIAPNDTVVSITDNEATSLQYGVFNLGFLAVANDPTGRDFAHWWSAQLHRACYDEPERGLFTDQKYCDLVPGLFERVQVLRDPGYNVASWNLSRRCLSIGAQGEICTNGRPLRFFHFTKVFGVGDTMLDRYGGSDLAVAELRQWYRRAVLEAAAQIGPQPAWHYATFQNGSPISRGARRLFRNRDDLMASFTNPFQTGINSFHAWLDAHHREALAAG